MRKAAVASRKERSRRVKCVARHLISAGNAGDSESTFVDRLIPGERFHRDTLCHEKAVVLNWDNSSTAHWYQKALLVLSDAALDGFWIGKGNPLELIHVDWVIRSRTLTLLQPHSWHAQTLTWRTPVSVSTFLKRVGKTSAVAEQVVRSTLPDNELLAHLTVAIVFVSGDNGGRPVAVPHRDRLQRMLAAAEARRKGATFALGSELSSRFPSIFARDFARNFPAALAPSFKTSFKPRSSDIDMYGHVNNAIFCLYLHDARVEAYVARHGGSIAMAAEAAVVAAAQESGGIDAVSGSGIAASSAAEHPLAGLSLSLSPIVAMSFDYSAPLYPGRTYGVELWEDHEVKRGLFVVKDSGDGRIAFQAKFNI